MEVKVLYMNGGEGETSYAKNSSIQKRILQTARSIVEEAALELCSPASFPTKLSVADLGCSSGPNALSVVSGVVDTVEERCRQLGRRPPEFQLFLNDLPGNDFNSVFRSLQALHEKREASAGVGKELGQCFVAGVPGSFHRRLFQSRSIHFFHSSSSLHWLSQAPPELQQHGMSLNKRSIHITTESPPFVVNAYAKQFEKDLSDFLRSRSEELVIGGRMVLTLPCRRTSDPRSEEVTSHWILLTQVLMDMVQEISDYTYVVIDKSISNFLPLLTFKKAMESIFASHFGGDIMDDFFLRYRKAIEEKHLPIKERKMSNLVISLTERERERESWWRTAGDACRLAMEGKVLHMNGGEGETSYAKNSSVQKRILQTARSAVEEAALELCSAVSFPTKLSVADLGCSSGPNALSVVSSVVDTVEERCRQLGRRPPEFQLFLNDLPGNDFNSVFRSLQALNEKREASAGVGKELGQCFVAGVPGSFHGRLFQSRSIHFFHSSTSVHWLSQAPPELQQHGVSLNKRSIYITTESPPFVLNAYAKQFEKDLTDFLRSRSEELVIGGRMVLTLACRRTSDPRSEEVTAYYWTLLTQVLMDMVQEGYITEAMVDSFNMPCYAPCATEMEGIIKREGSFSINYLETLEVAIFHAAPENGDHMTQNGNALSDSARFITNSTRAAVEPILASHFGGDIMDDFFLRYRKALEEKHLPIKSKMSNLVISLRERERERAAGEACRLAMEVKVLNMNGGEGETSYAKNSSIQVCSCTDACLPKDRLLIMFPSLINSLLSCLTQKSILQTARSAVEEAVLELCSAVSFPSKLSVADLGCSSGPNALSVVSSVVDTVEERCRQLGRRPPEFQLFLNDLPGNDFNSVFRSLQALHEKREASAGVGKVLGQCFVAGVPGSFHGRLFQSRSIHFFHSSSCLHWLSQAPPELQQHGVSLNKRSIHIATESPPFVVNAYAKQFEKDLSDFLRSRSEELVIGGRMVLTLPCRRTSDPRSEEVTSYWTLQTQVLMDMVQEGYITEAMVASFNIPCYAPCATEMEGIIKREGSFSINYLETLEVVIFHAAPENGDHMTQNGNALSDTARFITNSTRAAVESMFASHFGGDIMDDFFLRYRKALEEKHLPIKESKMSNLVISLVRDP
ncbi:hypothetical protein Taro_038864 [Colocasia esculenta]|uniref:Uncharacterized protein n=1 Tax=Colocasia esculenta TaxID=4460 RepID=A0A843WNG3_COLES|nr:hypothetical protein [Colocasia esculenta]